MSDRRPLVLLGTSTRDNDSKGIYAARQDIETGQLEIVGHGPPLYCPTYIAVHPSRKIIYAINSMGGGEGGRTSTLTALALNPDTGEMSVINTASTKGSGTCHVNVDSAATMVLTASFEGGCASAHLIKEDGGVTEATWFIKYEGSSCHRRQASPHAHSVWVDPTDQYALICDLGTDLVNIYKMNKENGTLVPGRPPYARIKGGCGARHLCFHPNGKWAYVISELNSAITFFDWDAETGALTEVQHIATLPEDYDGPNNTAADIHCTPDGSLLYGTNRGQDMIIMCRVDQETGKLTFLGYEPCGDHPRNFGIDPGGKFLYCCHMNSDDVFCYRINYDTGLLERIEENTLALPAPVCIKWV